MDMEHMYSTSAQKNLLLQKYHTVKTMMNECERSRSWSYQMIASYPGERHILMNLRTGEKELAVPRTFVTRYMLRVRRGNPNW